MHLWEEVAPLGPSSPFPDHPLPLFSFLPSPPPPLLSFLRLSTRFSLPSLSLSLLSSSSFSSLARESIILWPAVAFRNLFVIKAAIYFTLIEEIGRLPLAATIYHVLFSLSLSLAPPPLSHFIASQEDYTLLWRCIHEYVCMIARTPTRDFYTYICFIFTARGYARKKIRACERMLLLFSVTKC